MVLESFSSYDISAWNESTFACAYLQYIVNYTAIMYSHAILIQE